MIAGLTSSESQVLLMPVYGLLVIAAGFVVSEIASEVRARRRVARLRLVATRECRRDVVELAEDLRLVAAARSRS